MKTETTIDTPADGNPGTRPGGLDGVAVKGERPWLDRTRRWSVRLTLLVMVSTVVTIKPARAQTPQSVPATQAAPTTGPGEDRAIIRVGDVVALTQSDFRRRISNIAPAMRARQVVWLVRGLAERRQLLLYLEEHPELAPMADVEAELAESMKKGKYKSREDFAAAVAKKGLTLSEYLENRRLRHLSRNLAAKGLKLIENEEDRKKLFDKNPDYYDGTQISLMHIEIQTLPWFTPEEYEAKRLEAEEIRRDLVEGKRTWEECVQKSDDRGTRSKNGLIGPTQRYSRLPEDIVAPVWDLEVGEISEVIQSARGFHIVKVSARHPGKRAFDDLKTKVAMQAHYQKKLPQEVMIEAQKKWPLVGIESPDLTGLLPAPPVSAETRPSGPETRPATGATNAR